MSWLRETRALSLPRVIDLPRVTDRVSFLYLDAVSIRQDETGVVAHSSEGRIRIPCASTLVLFLGAGTSITQPAALTLARHGTTVVWTGVEGVGVSAAARPLTSSSAFAEAQATAWTDPQKRRDIARRLYQFRFPEEIGDDVDLDTLRGMEGARVRAAYDRLRRIHGIPDWRRRFSGSNLDPVNVALNVANSMLYEAAGAVVAALGFIPSLGFIHSGNARSFVLDLADLFKTSTSIPSAFACAESKDPAADARHSMRSYLADLRIHARLVRFLSELFPVDDTETNRLIGESGYVEGGWNQESGE